MAILILLMLLFQAGIVVKFARRTKTVCVPSHQYWTDYSVDDCIGLLSRKNIYDTMQYLFEQTAENAGELDLRCMRNYMLRGVRRFIYSDYSYTDSMVMSRGDLYRIWLEEENGRTYIHMELIHGVCYLDLPYYPKTTVDQFMEQKLSAKPY